MIKKFFAIFIIAFWLVWSVKAYDNSTSLTDYYWSKLEAQSSYFYSKLDAALTAYDAKLTRYSSDKKMGWYGDLSKKVLLMWDKLFTNQISEIEERCWVDLRSKQESDLAFWNLEELYIVKPGDCEEKIEKKYKTTWIAINYLYFYFNDKKRSYELDSLWSIITVIWNGNLNEKDENTENKIPSVNFKEKASLEGEYNLEIVWTDEDWYITSYYYEIYFNSSLISTGNTKDIKVLLNKTWTYEIKMYAYDNKWDSWEYIHTKEYVAPENWNDPEPEAKIWWFKVELSKWTKSNYYNISVKALDETWAYLENYTGSILVFSDSDTNAIFSENLGDNNYVFKDHDDGRVLFNNSVKFSKNWLHDISVYDIESEGSFWKDEIEVVLDPGLSIESNSYDDHILLGNTDDVEIASFDLDVDWSSLNIKEIVLENQLWENNSDNIISSAKLVLWTTVLDLAVPVNGEILFQTNWLELNPWSEKKLKVLVDLKEITNNTNIEINYWLRDLDLELLESGDDLNNIEINWENVELKVESRNEAIIDSDTFYVRNSTVSVISEDLENTEISEWENEIYNMKISADTRWSIELWLVSFSIDWVLWWTQLDTVSDTCFINSQIWWSICDFSLYIDWQKLELDESKINMSSENNLNIINFILEWNEKSIVKAWNVKSISLKASITWVINDDNIKINLLWDSEMNYWSFSDLSWTNNNFIFSDLNSWFNWFWIDWLSNALESILATD